MTICEMCGGDFVPRNKKRPARTCSKLCKNKLASKITTKQFSDPKAREVQRQRSLEQKKNPEYWKKFNKSIAQRQARWEVKGFPREGIPHTEESKKKISNGNRGRYKGKTWDEIYGKDIADRRRKENSKSMKDLNSTLLVDRLSKLENMVFEYFEPLGFIQGEQIGKYVVDFINFETNTIIEFNGDFWHMNPKLYERDFTNPVTKIVAEDKWSLDKQRKEYLEQKGYNVITLWETDVITSNRTINEQAIKSAISDFKSKKKNQL